MPTIKLTLREVLDSQNGIEDIESKDLPFKAGFRFQKISRKLVQELRDFEHSRNADRKKRKIDLPLSPDATDKEKADRVKKEREFIDALEANLETEVELDIPMIPAEMFEDIPLKGQTYRVLWFIFEDGIEKEDADEKITPQ